MADTATRAVILAVPSHHSVLPLLELVDISTGRCHFPVPQQAADWLPISDMRHQEWMTLVFPDIVPHFGREHAGSKGTFYEMHPISIHLPQDMLDTETGMWLESECG